MFDACKSAVRNRIFLNLAKRSGSKFYILLPLRYLSNPEFIFALNPKQMKKISLSILFALALFASCKKSDSVPEEAKPNTLHDVSFNVSGFSQTIVEMGTKSSASVKAESAGSHVNYIVYCIYNKDGVLLKKVDQIDKTSAGFGVINEQLPAGSYTLAVGAGTRRLSVPGEDLLSRAFISSYGIGDLFGDTFVKVQDFVIDEKDHQGSVQVERIVGKLELAIQDKIPSEVNKITLMFNSVSYYGFKYTISGSGIVTETIDVSEADKISEGKVFNSYVLPMKETSSLTTDVTISCYNAKGDVIVNKVVKNVTFERNKKTILSGKLFENTSNHQSNFQITIPSTWEDTKTVNF